ncbi:MAG: hypothetical protein N2645_14500 [Clostridia bacterium]|nr:hypothetical protein [Clostridia bacterium]
MNLKNKSFLNKGIFILCIFLFLLSSACSSKPEIIEKKTFLKDISNFGLKLAGATENHLPPGPLQGYGLRLFDLKGNFISDSMLSYQQGTLDYFVSIANANPSKDKIALILFVDGKPQRFSVDGQKDEKLSYVLDFEANSLINVPVSFRPVFGKGSSHRIYFSIVYNMDEKPGNENIPFFTSSLMMEYKVDSSSKVFSDDTPASVVPLPDSLKDAAAQVNVGFIIGEGDKVDFTRRQQTKFKAKKGGTATFTLGEIGRSGSFSAVLFIDNTPVRVFNGRDFFKWSNDGNQMLKHKASIPVPVTSGDHVMYVIVVPMEGKECKIFSSEKVLLQVED